MFASLGLTHIFVWCHHGVLFSLCSVFLHSLDLLYWPIAITHGIDSLTPWPFLSLLQCVYIMCYLQTETPLEDRFQRDWILGWTTGFVDARSQKLSFEPVTLPCIVSAVSTAQNPRGPKAAELQTERHLKRSVLATDICSVKSSQCLHLCHINNHDKEANPFIQHHITFMITTVAGI